MSVNDARAHLSKAREFLEAAEVNRDLELFNAATSAAVISGINSKDAICTTLSRLLKLKTKSQYQPVSVAAADATKAVEWATRLLEGADEVVSSR